MLNIYLFTAVKEAIQDVLSIIIRKGDNFIVTFEISDVHLLIHIDAPNSSLTQSKHFTIDKLIVLPREISKELDLSELMERIAGHFRANIYIIESKKIQAEYLYNTQKIDFHVSTVN